MDDRLYLSLQVIFQILTTAAGVLIGGIVLLLILGIL